MSARDLVPHRRPMRLIDRLLEVGDGTGLLEAKVPDQGLMIDEKGRLAEVALAELMAQGFAALRGYEDALSGKPPSMGFLVGIRKIRIFGRTSCGEHLHIRLKTIAVVNHFAVAEGRVTAAADNRLLAEGTIKLWIPPQGKAMDQVA